MGRFYKTASANPLDYMHKINAPLMERALQFNDQAISAQGEQGQAIGSAALNFKRLADDDPDAAIIAKQYNDQVDQLSKTVAADPANWRKQIEPLRTLKKSLLDDYTTGPIAKMQANYSAYQTWKTAVDKQIEKGTLDADTANAYEQHYLGNWRKAGAGTAYKNGRYNILKMDGVMNNMNIKKELSDGIDKLKASGVIRESPTQKGMYVMDTTHGEEGVTPDRVLSMAMANMSPQMQQYLKSRQQVGLMHGMYDEQGNMITPYTKGVMPELVDRAKGIIAQTRITDPKKADRMQAEIDSYIKSGDENINWNPNSGLAPILKGIVDANSWMKTTDKTTLKADPVALPVWLQGRREGQQNADRADRNYWQARNREDKLDRYKQVDDWNREKLQLQLDAKAAGKKGADAKKKLEENAAKVELGLINNPNFDYEVDVQNAKFDPKASLRAKMSLDEANTTFLKGQGETAKDYIAFLGGRKSTEETAKAYVQAKNPYTNGAALLGEESGRVFSNLIDNTRWLPTSLKSDAGQKWDEIYKLGKDYNKTLDGIYERNNNADLQAQVVPFTPEAQGNIATLINNRPDDYFSIDDKTGERTETPKIVKAIGGISGNSQSRLGFQAEVEGGKKVWIFPSKDEAITGVNKSYILDGLSDKKSALAAILKDGQVNDVLADFRQGVPSPEGLRSMITIGKHKFSATLTNGNSPEGGGKVILKDEAGDPINTFESVAKFVEMYNQAVQQQKVTDYQNSGF